MPRPCPRPSRWLITLVAVIVTAGCKDAPAPAAPPAHRAFYYWRTTFRLSPVETAALTELAIDRLYLRVFDVDWQAGADGPVTLGPVTRAADATIPAGLELVPVVYLRNQVFQQLPAAREAELARWTWGQVQARTAGLGLAPRELQLDCDWTDSTRDRFFGFIRELGALVRPAGVALSATIRLHQIKYRERTGVPPVERGMLMFYNMGRFSADPQDRAIFDAEAARSYLARIAEYPLPLDAALPIWSWTLHLRDDQVLGLLQSTGRDDLTELDFVRPDGPDRVVVTRTAFLHGTLVRDGDVLKIETTGPDQLDQAARMLAPHLARGPRPRTIALFDLSEGNLARHDLAALDRVLASIR